MVKPQCEVLTQDKTSGDIFDISQLVTTATWETNFESQPGKLALSYINDPDVNIKNGAVISFKYNKKGIFFGRIFRKAVNEKEIVTVTAYDQLRYLKNKDTRVITKSTASEVFAAICKDYQLTYSVKNASSYVLPARVEDDKSMFEIIQNANDKTIINTGQWYIIRDNFGVIEYVDINALKTDLFIGDESLATGMDYESSIDDDTYNQIKLVKENSETKKREIYIAKDSGNISKWGTLQYFEKMDEKANAAQIKAKADMILKVKNKETKKLVLPCLGDTQVSAGSGIVVGLKKLEKEGIKQNTYFIVSSCSHTFTNDYHKMDLTMYLI